jgi:3-oxoacyl-[acyl-carrier-protein] synthase III
MDCLRAENAYTEDSLEFMKRLLLTSGVGPKTAWPPSITRALDGLPRLTSSEQAREESKTVIFEVVRDVLSKTNLKPKDIDILIINCSLFSPTPSLCALVIHEFNMRSDILSYNLSGMVSNHTAPSPLSLCLSLDLS